MSNHDKEKVHNMTPNVSEKEAKEVRDKFDATYMKGRGKVDSKGEVKEFTQEQKDAAKKGAEGGLGLIAGTLGKIGKAFGNAAKQYVKGFKNPANQQTTRPTGYFKPFHRDGKVYSRQDINDAFKARFRPEAQQTIRPPKSPSTNFGRADAQVKMRETYKNLDKLK